MLIYRGDSPGGHFVPDFRNRYRRLRVGGHAFYILIHFVLRHVFIFLLRFDINSGPLEKRAFKSLERFKVIFTESLNN